MHPRHTHGQWSTAWRCASYRFSRCFIGFKSWADILAVTSEKITLEPYWPLMTWNIFSLFDISFKTTRSLDKTWVWEKPCHLLKPSNLSLVLIPIFLGRLRCCWNVVYSETPSQSWSASCLPRERVTSSVILPSASWRKQFCPVIRFGNTADKFRNVVQLGKGRCANHWLLIVAASPLDTNEDRGS